MISARPILAILKDISIRREFLVSYFVFLFPKNSHHLKDDTTSELKGLLLGPEVNAWGPQSEPPKGIQDAVRKDLGLENRRGFVGAGYKREGPSEELALSFDHKEYVYVYFCQH